jgi:hypothetical protein
VHARLRHSPSLRDLRGTPRDPRDRSLTPRRAGTKAFRIRNAKAEWHSHTWRTIAAWLMRRIMGIATWMPARETVRRAERELLRHRTHGAAPSWRSRAIGALFLSRRSCIPGLLFRSSIFLCFPPAQRASLRTRPSGTVPCT